MEFKTEAQRENFIRGLKELYQAKGRVLPADIQMLNEMVKEEPDMAWGLGSLVGAGAGSGLSGGAVNAPRPGQTNSIIPPHTMIGMRMRWHDHKHPFTNLVITNTEAGNFLILVVIGEQHTVLEDDKAMFPSDALVTKLRMMTP